MFTLLCILYITCCIMSYSLSEGFWQGKYNNHNKVFSIIVSVLGPLSLLITFLETEYGKYGFKL